MYKIPLLLVLLIVTVNVQCQTQCLQDHQCGNTPFSGCLKQANVLPGLGYNDQTKTLYFVSKFNTSSITNFGDPYIMKITNDANLSIDRKLTFEIPEGGGGRTVFNLNSYIPSLDYFYLTLNQIGSPILALVNKDGSNYTHIWNFRNVPLEMFFQAYPPRTYQADFGIHYYDYILTSHPPDTSTRNTLYQTITTQGLSVQGNDLYVATYPGTFYRGSTLCNNCSADDLTKLFVDPTYSSTNIRAFLTTPSFIYYASDLGITEMPLTGDLTKRRVLTSDQVDSIAYSNDGFLYYTVTGANTIKKISLSGNHPQITTILSPNNSFGVCACNHGLAEPNCTCDLSNHALYWSQSQPYCTPIHNGYPDVCFANWQCSSSPYVWCASGQCGCRFNFYGDGCTACKGNIVWQGGLPVCESSS